MPKQKTHKGLRKRVKITSSGKVKYKGPYGGHLMGSKSAKRRRRIGKPAIMIPVLAKKVKLMLNQ
jgi:large subunit ribosomal protein L35